MRTTLLALVLLAAVAARAESTTIYRVDSGENRICGEQQRESPRQKLYDHVPQRLERGASLPHDLPLTR